MTRDMGALSLSLSLSFLLSLSVCISLSLCSLCVCVCVCARLNFGSSRSSDNSRRRNWPLDRRAKKKKYDLAISKKVQLQERFFLLSFFFQPTGRTVAKG